VVEPGGSLEAPGESRVAGDLAALVADHDRARPDPGRDAQPHQRHRHRVAVLPDRDQRLHVDARRGVLGRVEVVERQLPQRPHIDPERLTDGLGAATDPPPEIGEAAVFEQLVELFQRRHLRHRHQVRATVAAHLALDAALLMGTLAASAGERRLEQVVGAQRDEAVLLDPPAAAQHLLDRGAQVVVADQREGAAEEVERLHVRLQERLLRLPLERDHERRARVAGPHHEQPDRAPLAGDLDHGLAPVDFRLNPGLVHLRHEHLVDRIAQLAPAATHVLPHRRLGHLGALLRHQPLPDPLRRVPLLARRLPIRQKPRVDQRPIRTQLRGRPPLRWLSRRRQRRRQRLPHRPPMHSVAARQLTDRQPLALTVPTDLLELLHSRSHPSCDLPPELDEARTVGPPSDRGGAKSDRRGGANSDRRAQSQPQDHSRSGSYGHFDGG
jgi:hypothetical protein